ncbi:ATP-binding cassette sub-family C member 10-like [Homarus americanus]|uniref:ATP-binding cassette sub-family C member 10-like n=1 Tax=Homarus americanus TaxID=6706 RepID=UPI001C44A8A9|nr:ATP-binding cassette sub-family C member 10-like [Homarus americanus]
MDPIFFNTTAFCGTMDFISWDTQKLNLGLCFQKAVITVPVFALLAIVSAYYIGRQSEWVVRRRKQMAIIYTRIVLTVLSLVLVVIEPILLFFVGHSKIYWVDGLVVGVQSLSWLVHLGYLTSLKTRLSVGTRGPTPIILAWLLTFLCTINLARTTWYEENGISKLIEKIMRFMALTQMCLQTVYLFTLFPKGSAGVSQYHELHREATETTPLMETSYNDYSGFHEAADPYHLGIAEERINVLSYLTFYWVNALMEKGSLGNLRTQDDLHDLPIQMRTDVIAQTVHRTMMISQPLPSDESERPRRQKYAFLKAIHKCYGVQFYSIGLLKLFGDILGFAGPLLLHELVIFIEKKDEDDLKGYTYAGGLCGAALVAIFCSIHFNYLLAKVNLRIRAAVISTVYRKVLQVSAANLSRFSTGEVVNLMSTDTDRIGNFCQSFHALWSLPLQLGITLYLLYQQIGIAFLAGVGVAIILIPVNKWLATKIGRLSVEMMSYKDRRVGLMTEILSMIRMVKLNAWEGTFKHRVNDERYGEVKALAGRKYLDAACVYFWASTPVLIPIITFTVYIALGNPLEPARVFTAVALFNMLIMPLNAFPWVLNGIVEAWVSLKRVERLMELPEQDLINYYTVVPEMGHKDSELQILITNGTFTWDGAFVVAEQDQEASRPSRSSPTGSNMSLIDSLNGSSGDEGILPTLKRVNLQLSKGQVVAIVGRVGSGKTSVLNAILAEMTKTHGVVAVAALHNGFGLATQLPWIQNGSIKDNILFGSSLDISRYKSVLSVCALDEDLHALPLRDNTMCGENGSSLSGGQKARVALARAVYQNKSIYLLDDVLSAVDRPVAQHIMKKCIHGFLAGRTVLLATNTVSLLTKTDWVISIQNGEINSQGPPSVVLPKLLSAEELSDDWWDETESVETKSSGAVSRRPSLDIFATGHGKSTDSIRKGDNEEERDYGELSSSVYYTYIVALGSVLSLTIFLSMILMQSSRNLTDMWLAYWVSQVTGRNSSGLTALVDKDTTPWMGAGTRPDPPKMATALTDSMQWFSSINPMHQFLAVQELPESDVSAVVDPSTKFYLTVYGILAASNTIFTLMRAFLFAYGGICAAKALHKQLLDAVLYAKISFFDNNPLGRILNRFSSDLYTVDDSLPFQMNIFFAQVFGLLGSVVVTIYGMPWILLLYIPLAFVYYTVQSFYRHTSRDLKRLHAVSLSPLYAHFTETLQGLPVIRAMRAVHRFSARADSLLEVSQRAQFDIQVASQWLNLRLQLIGLAMLAGVSTLALLQHHFDAIDAGLVGLVVSYALTVSNFLNSVVGSLTETERELVSVERVHQYLEGTEPERREGTILPPFGWLSHGSIKFQNVCLRYQAHNPYALRKVSFEIGASEKVGIIGRTGAGKSSIFLALFRLVELNSGHIFVDNVDISKLSLKKLRSSMAIVTQDAFLFSGTIRENLDPCSDSLDTQIWQAVQSCHLTTLVQHLGGLEARIEEAGRAMSAGERQLFCLARALLCRTKIVCIDEGTSQLDNETDEQIQQTIRSAFRNKTVIIIAHRVHTVRDCDRILVMSEGEVVECGRPTELLSNRNSIFYSVLQSQ